MLYISLEYKYLLSFNSKSLELILAQFGPIWEVSIIPQLSHSIILKLIFNRYYITFFINI